MAAKVVGFCPGADLRGRAEKKSKKRLDKSSKRCYN